METTPQTSQFKTSLMSFVRHEDEKLAAKIRRAPFHPLAALIYEAGYEPEDVFSKSELIDYAGEKKNHPASWAHHFPDPQDILRMCRDVGMHPALLWVSNPHVPMPENLLKAHMMLLRDAAYPALDHNVSFGALQQERHMGVQVLSHDPIHKRLLQECDYARDEVNPRPILQLPSQKKMRGDAGLLNIFKAEEPFVPTSQREAFNVAVESALTLRQAHEAAVCDKAASLRGLNKTAEDKLHGFLSAWYEDDPKDVLRNIVKWAFRYRKEKDIEDWLAGKLTRQPEMFGTPKPYKYGKARPTFLHQEFEAHLHLKAKGLAAEPKEGYRRAYDDVAKPLSVFGERKEEARFFVENLGRYLSQELAADAATQSFAATVRANRNFRSEVRSPEFEASTGFYTNNELLNEVLGRSDYGPVVMSAAEEKAILRELAQESRKRQPAYL